MTPAPRFLYPVMSFFWRIVSYRNPVWSHRHLPGCVALWVNGAGWLWDSCGYETAALSLTHSLSHTPCKMTLCRQAAVLCHDLVGSWELTTTRLPQSFRSLASQGLIPRRAAHCRRGPAAAAAGTHTSVLAQAQHRQGKGEEIITDTARFLARMTAAQSGHCSQARSSAEWNNLFL